MGTLSNSSETQGLLGPGSLLTRRPGARQGGAGPGCCWSPCSSPKPAQPLQRLPLGETHRAAQGPSLHRGESVPEEDSSLRGSPAPSCGGGGSCTRGSPALRCRGWRGRRPGLQQQQRRNSATDATTQSYPNPRRSGRALLRGALLGLGLRRASSSSSLLRRRGGSSSLVLLPHSSNVLIKAFRGQTPRHSRACRGPRRALWLRHLRRGGARPRGPCGADRLLRFRHQRPHASPGTACGSRPSCMEDRGGPDAPGPSCPTGTALSCGLPVWPLSVSPVTNNSVYLAGSCHKLWRRGRGRQVSKHPPASPPQESGSAHHHTHLPLQVPLPRTTAPLGPVRWQPTGCRGPGRRSWAESQPRGQVPGPEDCLGRQEGGSPVCLLLQGHCDPRPGPQEPVGGGRGATGGAGGRTEGEVGPVVTVLNQEGSGERRQESSS